MSAVSRPRAGTALRLAAVVAGLGLLSGVWLYASYNGPALLAHRPPLVSLRDALCTGLLDWSLWLPAWPLVLLLARRVPFRRGGVGRALVAHALAAPLLSLLQLALFALASVALRAWLYGAQPDPLAAVRAALVAAFGAKFESGILVALLASIAVQIVRAVRAAHAEELRAKELARELAEARLAALSAALEPHFLFNALGTIQSLVRTEPATAERMIARLGELLRACLATAGRQEIALAEELALLESYLAIERERFGERLRVVLDVPADALDARVPALLLQPLAENAVRHGLSQRTGAAELELAVRAHAGRLHIRLRDGGPGFAPGERAGLGLANARSRLAALHGEAASLSVAAAPQGGAEIAIELPFSCAGAA